MTVEDDELAEIAIESSHTVDIEKFVPKVSIDDRYRDTPYYLAPEDKVGQEAFAVIRDAMKKKKMVGIARVVMARRERVMMLEPFGKGIMGTTLHYPYEIRSEEAVFEEIPDYEAARPDGGLGGGHHRQDDRRVRAGQVRGPLRERDDRTDPLEAGGLARAQGEGGRRGLPTSSTSWMRSGAASTMGVEGVVQRLHPRKPLKPHPRSAQRKQRGAKWLVRPTAYDGASNSMPRLGLRSTAWRRTACRRVQELADEAFRDLLKKHRRPTTLKEMLRESARSHPANDQQPLPRKRSS